MTRLFAALGLLALSVNLAWGQPGPPRQACNVLQAQWASAWPNSSRSRTLDENRSVQFRLQGGLADRHRRGRTV